MPTYQEFENYYRLRQLFIRWSLSIYSKYNEGSSDPTYYDDVKLDLTTQIDLDIECLDELGSDELFKLVQDVTVNVRFFSTDNFRIDLEQGTVSTKDGKIKLVFLKSQQVFNHLPRIFWICSLGVLYSYGIIKKETLIGYVDRYINLFNGLIHRNDNRKLTYSVKSFESKSKDRNKKNKKGNDRPSIHFHFYLVLINLKGILFDK